MKKGITISIPTPCHESWQEMTPVEKGRFCNSCQQAVTDFTTMSDQQVIDFLKTHPGSHCGRFLPDQLNTPIQALLQTRQRFVPAVVFAGFTGLLALFNQQSKAADKEKNVTMQLAPVIAADEQTKPIAADNDSSSYIIRGRTFIKDGRKRDTLMYASIHVKDTKIGTVSDLHGYFQLPLSKTLFSGEVTLIIQAVGIETQQIIVQLDEQSLSKELVAVTQEYTTTGLMLIDKNGKPYHADNSLRARLRRLFSRR